MNTQIERTELSAVSAHERVDWEAEEKPEDIAGHDVLIIQTDQGQWLALCDAQANVGEPVVVIQQMKSSKLRRPGRVWAKWKGDHHNGYWPPDVPARMPVYHAA